MEQDKREIVTIDGMTYEGVLLSQKTIQTETKTYLSSKYLIDGQGEREFLRLADIKGGDFQKSHSMIPFEYMDKTGRDFNWSVYEGTDIREQKKLVNMFVTQYQNFRDEGRGLYIYSQTKGSGKTLLACCLANEIIRKYASVVKFISVLDLLDLTKKGYNSQEDNEAVENLKRAGILILDDLGIELSREWVNTVLYQLINYRYTERLVTIVTSNLEIDSLKADERIKDRIDAMCIGLHLPEVAVRSNINRQHKRNFLSSLEKKSAPCEAGNNTQGI